MYIYIIYLAILCLFCVYLSSCTQNNIKSTVIDCEDTVEDMYGTSICAVLDEGKF